MSTAPLRSHINDREFDRFTENSDGDTAVRTVGETTITNAIVPGYSSFKFTLVDITDDEWLPVPPTPLPGRASVGIQNRSGVEVAFREDDIPSDYDDEGWSIINLGEFFMDVKNGAQIYARSSSGPRKLRVLEFIG